MGYNNKSDWSKANVRQSRLLPLTLHNVMAVLLKGREAHSHTIC